MSVHAYDTKSGTAYRVRWTTPDGRMHSRSFTGKGAKKQAEAFDNEIKSRKNKGELLPFFKGTLGDAAQEWWQNKVTANLALNTQHSYSRLWNKHVAPHLGHIPLTTIASDANIINAWLAKLQAEGVGAPTRYRAHAVLSSILTYAKKANWIGNNSAHDSERPKVTSKPIQAMSPRAVELLRQSMLRKAKRDQLARLRDAAAVSLMSYSGLRPGEVWSLTWSCVGQQTLLVYEATAFGQAKSTKTYTSRSTLLVEPVRLELEELRKAVGNPAPSDLIFPDLQGEMMSDEDWRNWRRRQFQAAGKRVAEAEAVDIEYAYLAGVNPNHCRHSFVSLLWRDERYTAADIAAWAGHSIDTQQRVYLHIIAELQGLPSMPAEKQIEEAREWAKKVDLSPPKPEEEEKAA